MQYESMSSKAASVRRSAAARASMRPVGVVLSAYMSILASLILMRSRRRKVSAARWSLRFWRWLVIGSPCARRLSVGGCIRSFLRRIAPCLSMLSRCSPDSANRRLPCASVRLAGAVGRWFRDGASSCECRLSRRSPYSRLALRVAAARWARSLLALLMMLFAWLMMRSTTPCGSTMRCPRSSRSTHWIIAVHFPSHLSRSPMYVMVWVMSSALIQSVVGRSSVVAGVLADGTTWLTRNCRWYRSGTGIGSPYVMLSCPSLMRFICPISARLAMHVRQSHWLRCVPVSYMRAAVRVRLHTLQRRRGFFMSSPFVSLSTGMISIAYCKGCVNSDIGLFSSNLVLNGGT